MARSTRAHRTRSTFKKSAGSHLTPTTKIVSIDRKLYAVGTRGGGYGTINNRCKCMNCRSSVRFF